jgi:hypothetical protein
MQHERPSGDAGKDPDGGRLYATAIRFDCTIVDDEADAAVATLPVC